MTDRPITDRHEEEFEAKIKDAFYEARNNRRTMDQAAIDAVVAIRPLLESVDQNAYLRGFTEAIPQMQAEVREVNEANGWYETKRTFGEDVALLHSEVSEALEAYRRWGVLDATNPGSGDPKPEGVGSELADVLIRLLDVADRYGVDLPAEYHRKLAFNRTRGYRHGGKKL